MPKQNEFRGIAHDVVESFTSRNNDVDGFWAIGQLCKYAGQQNSNTLRIDLKHKLMIPSGSKFDNMIEHYSHQLLAQIQLRRLPAIWMTSAELFLSFYPDTKYSNFDIQPKLSPYICVLEIESWSGRIYSKTKRGKCRPHNPLFEHKSTRV